MRETPVVGTRYCIHLHAHVPENLQYMISELAPAQEATSHRLLPREFRCLPFAGGDDKSKAARAFDIRHGVAPLTDGVAVRAEGLTHHQSRLVPLSEAQKDLGIKYRSLTQTREDLVDVAYAQKVRELCNLAGFP